jgi:hypothetical protein
LAVVVVVIELRDSAIADLHQCLLSEVIDPVWVPTRPDSALVASITVTTTITIENGISINALLHSGWWLVAGGIWGGIGVRHRCLLESVAQPRAYGSYGAEAPYSWLPAVVGFLSSWYGECLPTEVINSFSVL